jgi:hypothetical protein
VASAQLGFMPNLANQTDPLAERDSAAQVFVVKRSRHVDPLHHPLG